jgi:hypothetical protein
MPSSAEVPGSWCTEAGRGTSAHGQSRANVHTHATIPAHTISELAESDQVPDREDERVERSFRHSSTRCPPTTEAGDRGAGPRKSKWMNIVQQSGPVAGRREWLVRCRGSVGASGVEETPPERHRTCENAYSARSAAAPSQRGAMSPTLDPSPSRPLLAFGFGQSPRGRFRGGIRRRSATTGACQPVAGQIEACPERAEALYYLSLPPSEFPLWKAPCPPPASPDNDALVHRGVSPRRGHAHR